MNTHDRYEHIIALNTPIYHGGFSIIQGLFQIPGLQLELSDPCQY